MVHAVSFYKIDILFQQSDQPIKFVRYILYQILGSNISTWNPLLYLLTFLPKCLFNFPKTNCPTLCPPTCCKINEDSRSSRIDYRTTSIFYDSKGNWISLSNCMIFNTLTTSTTHQTHRSKLQLMPLSL